VASDRGAALARLLLGAEEGEWGGWNGGASHVWVGGAVDGIIGGGHVCWHGRGMTVASIVLSAHVRRERKRGESEGAADRLSLPGKFKPIQNLIFVQT
jgi:hypothetical protein